MSSFQILDFTCVSAEECSLLYDGAKNGSRVVIGAEVRIISNSAVAFYKIRMKLKGSIVSYDEMYDDESGTSCSSSDDDLEEDEEEKEDRNEGKGYGIRNRFNRFPSKSSQSSGVSRDNVYYIYRRYSDFFKLNQRLGKQLMPHISSSIPSLPAKRILKMKKFDSAFIESRRAGLDEYLTTILEHPVASKNPIVKEFLNDSIWMKPQKEIDEVKNAAYSIGRYLAECADHMQHQSILANQLCYGTDCFRNEMCSGPNCRGSLSIPKARYGVHKRVCELRDEYDYERAYEDKGTLIRENSKPSNDWFYLEFAKGSEDDSLVSSSFLHGIEGRQNEHDMAPMKIEGKKGRNWEQASSVSFGPDFEQLRTDGWSTASGHSSGLGIDSEKERAAGELEGLESKNGGNYAKVTGSTDTIITSQFNSSVNDRYPSTFVLNQRAQFLRDYSRKRFGVRRVQL